HAEITLDSEHWAVGDSGSSNGTFVNGIRIGRTGQRLKKNDLVLCGSLALLVVELCHKPAEVVRTPNGQVMLAAAAQRSWDEAIEKLMRSDIGRRSYDKLFIAILRAGDRLCTGVSLEEWLRPLLADIVGHFQAQRGAICLAEARSGALELRSLVVA